MAQTVETGELRTSLPLLIPLWLLSALSGVLFEFSTFLGWSLLAVVAIVCCSACKVIGTRKASVKAIEVALISALIPLLFLASTLSSTHYPSATAAVNAVLLSSALPHYLILLKKMRKISPSCLIIFSASILFLIPLTPQEPSFSTILPTIAVVSYAVPVLVESIYRLRDRLPMPAIKLISLALTFACLIASVSFYYLDSNRLTGMIIETIVCAVIYFFIDFYEFEMRTPFAQRNQKTYDQASCRFWNKFLVISIVLVWTGIVPVMNCLEQHKKDWMGFTGFTWYASTIALPTFHAMVKRTMRELTPRDGKPSTQKIALAIAASIVVLLAMIAIAVYAIIETSPYSIPPALLFFLISILFIAFTYLLDYIREIFAKVNAKLAWASGGLAVYCIVTIFYLAETDPINGGAAETPFLARYRAPISGVCGIASCLLFALMSHFIVAAYEESDRVVKEMAASKAAEAVPIVQDSSAVTTSTAVVSDPVAEAMLNSGNSVEEGVREAIM